ncbi:hypothetical protein KCU71_g131, partial [Aureobasidium melanogenum]
MDVQVSFWRWLEKKLIDGDVLLLSDDPTDLLDRISFGEYASLLSEAMKKGPEKKDKPFKMKFDFSVLAAATALVGSATAAPQNSNNGNWQSYASQASSYWQSANPTATGEWSSWANAASSYWNSVSPSAAPSQWSSYASAASSYWASHSGSMITAAPSAFPWAGGFGPNGGAGGWRGGNGYGPFGDISNGTNSGWGPWGTGAWTSGPWTSWWGEGNCPDSTWSGWTSGPWGTNAPWTSWSGCKASTTATSTITTTVSGTPTTTVAYGIRVNAASAGSTTSGSSGSATAATTSHTGAANNVGVSGAGVGIGAAVAAVLMLDSLVFAHALPASGISYHNFKLAPSSSVFEVVSHCLPLLELFCLHLVLPIKFMDPKDARSRKIQRCFHLPLLYGHHLLVPIISRMEASMPSTSQASRASL